MYKFLHLLLGYIQTRLITKSALVGRDKNARGREKFTTSVKLGKKARLCLSPYFSVN